MEGKGKGNVKVRVRVRAGEGMSSGREKGENLEGKRGEGEVPKEVIIFFRKKYRIRTENVSISVFFCSNRKKKIRFVGHPIMTLMWLLTIQIRATRIRIKKIMPILHYMYRYFLSWP
jgi:hypothetical protein